MSLSREQEKKLSKSLVLETATVSIHTATTVRILSPSVILFWYLNDRIDSAFLQFFLHLHFNTTYLNNRRQLNGNDLRASSVCKTRSNKFSWKAW